MLDRVDERRTRRRIVELADVRRNERFVAAGRADGVLEISAEGDHRGPRSRQLDDARRVAARAAHELEAARCAIRARAQHAVVAARDDCAVVDEQRVGDAGEPPERFAVVDDQRFAARVGARHHQHELLRRLEPCRTRGPTRRLVEEQVLQRRVRQHRSEPREPGGNTGECRVGESALAQQHDRALYRVEQRMLAGVRDGQRRQRGGVGRPSRQTASPRVPCVPAAGPRLRRCAHRRRDGIRRGP